MLRFLSRTVAAVLPSNPVRRAAVPRALALLLLFASGGSALAQTVSLTGGTYTQDFNTLSNVAGSTTNTALPTGWLLTETGGGARDNEQYAVDTGSSNTGDTFSYGSAGSTDRAFGGLQSGTLIPVVGACFTNNTGATLTSVDIAYTGEQWRIGNTAAARDDRLDFQINTNPGSVSLTASGTWTDVNTLDFTNPVKTNASAGALDGNSAANRAAVSATIGSLSIANGGNFCIRWNDLNASGADDGLAVDDFSLTIAGSPTPVISINDVAALEGDSGSTTFTFGIGLSQPAGPGGVSFDIATANGTATAGSDYVAGSATLTIPAGSSSTTFAVSVIGDTTPEADETFFVNLTNVSGATVSDGQGQGTIQNDDVAIVQIHDIQGNGLTSPINGAVVTTEGIVTALKFNNGFFLQTPDANVDADPNTSQGIFVFTSSAPPASAAVGNRIRVTGTVAEFVPSSNLNQLSITQLTGPTIVVLSTGNPLPTPVTLSSADFNAASTPGSAEKFEGMRATVADAVVVAGSDGNITESSATSSTTGVFHVVLDGVARPFREPGIGVMDVFPIPGGKTPPRFDTNQERIMIRSRGQVGATSLALDVGARIANMTGVLDYFAGTWALLPDIGSGTATGGRTPTAVADARPEDVTIAAANLLRLFDEINDANGGPTLTAAALDKRLTKTSLAICDFLKAPDILGVVEVENLRVLGLLADRINSTCARAPQYVPYLVQGNDVGGINVGFLVNTRSVGATARVEVLEVTQFGAATVLNNPDGSTSLLNDRPPLLLRAIVHAGNGATYPVTVIVNHLRSLNGLDDTAPGSNGWASEGDRVRTKRGQQAMFLANLVHTRQIANPAERIVLLGDFNAFEFNDGYVDVMGIVRGNEAAEPNVISYFDSPITRPLIDGSELILNPLERYSYEFDGNAQTLDHVVINEPIVMEAADIRVDHARINADFGVHNFGVAGNAIRMSDHDPVRIAISVAAFRSADLGVVASGAPASIRVGNTANYTVDVDNAGPNDASPASLALVFDAVVTPVVTAPAGWTCAAPVQTATTTTVTCTAATFALGATDSFAIAVVTDSTLANRALTLQAAIASTTADPANANNQATAAVNVLAESDLGVTASGSGGVDVGGNAGFTVGVANAGPDAAAFAGLALVFDAVVSPVVTAPAGWSCAAPVQTATTTTVTCTIASFASGGSGSFTATVPVGAALGGQTLTLAAAITSQYTDPNKANDTATASVTVRAIADLAMTATAGASPVQVGGTASYSATVSNGGPSTATGPSVVLEFDAVVTPTVNAPGGWSCTAPVQTATTTSVSCSAGSLAPGAGATFTADVPATAVLAGRSVVMTATASSGTADTATANNAATASVAIATAADLSVTVAAGASPVSPGSIAGYTVTVANGGPSAAANPSLTLVFDALVAPTVTTPGGWSCATPTQTATTTTVTCSAASLAAGANANFPVSFPATNPLAGRLVQLIATVASATADTAAGNDTASAAVQIRLAADLSVAVTAAAATAPVGSTVVYNATVANAGPNAAASVTITFDFDALVTPTIAGLPAPWTCTTTTQTATLTRVVCSGIGAGLGIGGSAPITASFPAVAALNGRTVRLTASIAAPVFDPVPGNNQASAQTLIQSSADLTVRMMGRSGRAGVFMVVVRNDGPSAAANPSLVVTGNLLPRNVSIVPATGWTCAPTTVATGFRFNCTAGGPLANGGEAFFGLAVAGRGPQAVTITATVSSATPDPDPTDNTAQRVLVGAGLPDECTHRFCRR